MQKIVLASSNSGKLKEFNQVLQGLDYEVVPQSRFDVPDADETGLSFVENAILKARHASRISGLPALADDSGLEVDLLDGAPGIFSARFSGEGATDEKNNNKLISMLSSFPESQRTARFQCLLVFMRHAEDPTPLICQGTWEGRILLEPRGENGFGYDPLFYIPALDCCSAELESEQKNRLSHRGQAVVQLVERLAERR
ncbi:MAG: RdgB/HAM1 family non-canonical purine NTP pyrophosphatase [Motiliproteus sp.]